MTIVLIISLLVLVATFVIAFVQNGRTEKSIRILSAGILLVAVILLCPLIINYNKCAEDDSIPLVTVILSALQLGSLDGDYPFWIGEATKISYIYRIFMIVESYLMLIVFGGFILSLFTDAICLIKFHCLNSFYDIFYFSELNKKSLLLAKTIRKSNKKALLVFYNCNEGNELKEDALFEEFLILKYDCSKMIQKPGHKLHFFMVKENHDENLSDGLQILNLYKGKFSSSSLLENVTISIFSEAKDADVILNSTDKMGISVKLVNTHQKNANELIFNHPFYNAPGWDDNKHISVLIVGADRQGIAVLKNAVWSCQLGEGCKVEINVVDVHSSDISQKLEHECPELFNPKWNINLNFYDADVTKSDFDKILKEKCLETNYAVVCLNDDELAIDIALFLRRFFIYSDSDYVNEPFIAVRIFDDEKAESVKELAAVNREKISLKGWDVYSSKAENYNIVPFGSNNSIYSYDKVVDNELDKLALNAHAAYQNMFSDIEVPRSDILKTFNYSEIDKKSNSANVLHIKYKLKMLGYEIKQFKNATEEEVKNSNGNVIQLKKLLEDDVVMEKLSRIEHDRWLSFLITEGWRGVSIDDAKIYSAKSGSHKHTKAKLHSCICTWDELDENIKVFDPHLKDYDAEFIRNIPSILGFEDSCINVSGVKYVLIKEQ